MTPFNALAKYIASRPQPRMAPIGKSPNAFLRSLSADIYEHAINQTQYLDPRDISEIQNNRLAALIEGAKKIPFYREYLNEYTGLVDFPSLRTISKLELRKAFDAETCINPGLAAYRIPMRTTGSTGVPLYFFQDKNAEPRHLARYHRMLDWTRRLPGDKIVRLMPHDHPGIESEGVFFKCGSPGAIEAQLENLCGIFETGPVILQSRASYLIRLAQLLEHKKSFKFRALISYTEQLLPDARAYIEKIFKAEIFDYYACNEISALGFECAAHDGFHIQSEFVRVDIVNAENKPAKAGEIGDVLVTHFDNEVMPFIRYKIGDRGWWLTGSCPCGRTLPRLKVAGRDIDTFTLPDGKSVYFPALFAPIAKMVSKILHYQVVRESKSSLVIKIVPTDKFNKEDEGYILNRFAQYLGTGVVTKIEIVGEIKSLPGGKHHRFVNLAPND